MNDGNDQHEEAAPYADLRKLSDPRELRALAHPVRMALFEALNLNDSLTATQASKIVGGSPTSVAYHLRTLAKYGYVEESESSGGRERPWRLSSVGFSFSSEGDAETVAAADALSRQLFKRWLARHEEYQQHRERWAENVRKATSDSNTVLLGTVEEFRKLQEDFGRLCEKYFDRIKNPELRPEGSLVFELQLFTHPIDASAYLADAPEDTPPQN